MSERHRGRRRDAIAAEAEATQDTATATAATRTWDVATCPYTHLAEELNVLEEQGATIFAILNISTEGQQPDLACIVWSQPIVAAREEA